MLCMYYELYYENEALITYPCVQVKKMAFRPCDVKIDLDCNNHIHFVIESSHGSDSSMKVCVDTKYGNVNHHNTQVVILP